MNDELVDVSSQEPWSSAGPRIPLVPFKEIRTDDGWAPRPPGKTPEDSSRLVEAVRSEVVRVRTLRGRARRGSLRHG